MSNPPQVVVQHDEPALASVIADRLITAVVEAQSARGHAHICLTGGGIGIACLAAVAASPAVDAVDWPAVSVWWSDERFVPSDSPDRNDAAARGALLDHVALLPSNVHPMPALDGAWGANVDAAAEAYADELAAAARPEDRGSVPRFDVLMLGMGPEGHIASLFPESPAMHDDRPVVAVRGCPKPPPTRISFTLPTINTAREVWFVVSGAGKASALHLALSADTGPLQVPAAGARGTVRTLALIDTAAASKLPPSFRPPATLS